MSPFGHEADVPMQLQHVCYQGGSTETVAVEASGGHPGGQKIAACTRPSHNPLPGRTIPDAEPWADRMMLLPVQ